MKFARFLTFLAIGVFVLAGLLPILSGNLEAAEGTEEDPIAIQLGQTWRYTPTFDLDLNPVLTVVADSAAMPADDATFGASSGYAAVDGKDVVVTIPDDAVVGDYFVKIKATTHNPDQTAYQSIAFKIQVVVIPDPDPDPDPNPGTTPAKTWKVKIALNGVDVKEVTVEDGKSLDPKIHGMKYYYLDEDGKEEWLVGTPITEDTTIYAFLPVVPKAITLPVILILFVTAIILIAAIVTRNPIIAAIGFITAVIAAILFFGKGRF